MAKLTGIDHELFPLNLGGNVFGWTADVAQSEAVLDAYAEAGGNFIDTADVYSAWVPGNAGGESETIIGNWMASRGNRDSMVIATKVGMNGGLSRSNVMSKVDESLRRLRTDYIDLYYAHKHDPDTPLEETLEAFDEVIRVGKVRVLGASNFDADTLTRALDCSRDNGWARYVALQPEYNLMERSDFEGALAGVCEREGLVAFPYYSLASGFLTGKYREGADIDSPRGSAAKAYLASPNGPTVLQALDEISLARKVPVATVALAWLKAQPSVGAPIASARSVEQLGALLAVGTFDLDDEEVKTLALASEQATSS